MPALNSSHIRPWCNSGRVRFLAFVIGVAAASPLRASDLDVFYGQLKYDTISPDTFTWGIEYRGAIADHLTGSLVWLNEGHVATHHRDGQALQLWWNTLPRSGGLGFEGGLGPYVYYDTAHPETGYADQHGLAALASIAADWYVSNRWLLFLRLNRVLAEDRFDTTFASFGFGYRFANRFDATPSEQGAEPATPIARWELIGFFGSTVADSSHRNTAAVEARRQLTDHLVVTAEFIDSNGHIGIGWHEAIVVQFWLQKQLSPRISVGAGAGVTMVGHNSGVSFYGPQRNPAAAVSVGLAYSLTRSWNARATWTRIGTDDNKDVDIFLFGVGRKF